jgi:hypothetical protein
MSADTEPAADGAGMTNEELVDRYRFVIEAIAELYAADAGMYIVERRNLGTELMRRLAQPALDLDALKSSVIGDVIAERSRQNEKWGVQRHSWVEWTAILGEEFGEVCMEAVDLHWGRSEDIQALRKELVQLAAVSVQIIEHIDEWGKR